MRSRLSAAANLYRQDGGPVKLGLAWFLTLSLLWLLMANPGRAAL